MNRFSFRSFFVFACALLALGSVAIAGSLDLDAAKKSGLVGETMDGLIEATLPNPSAEVTSLVNRTNKGRLMVYKDTAAKQGIPVGEVQKIAAEKIYSLAHSGEFLMINGRWIQKK